MTRTQRQLTVAVMVTGIIGASRPALAGDADAHALPRVRSSSPSIVALIERAAERSATFRALVDTINASDGIVYVEEGECGRGVRACFVAMADAGPNRLLRVVVDPHKVEWDLMGSIGHELRHTIEVLNEAQVRRSIQMYNFYSREGKRSRTSRTFETEAAIAAGEQVRGEVRRYQRRMERN